METRRIEIAHFPARIGMKEIAFVSLGKVDWPYHQIGLSPVQKSSVRQDHVDWQTRVEDLLLLLRSYP
jgi:hypothetical protein